MQTPRAASTVYGGLGLLLLIGLAVPPPALAGGVVGTGTAASCTTTALVTAMAGGGTVTFRCGPAPVTIPITTSMQVVKQTAIDGGGLVTFSGNGQSNLFFEVQKGVQLTLTNLTTRDAGGSFAYNFGRLTVANCTLSNNTGPVALYNLGRLTVSKSTFADNGQAILNDGTLAVEDCTFVGNFGTGFGGAITTLRGKVTVSNSTFTRNGSAPGSAGAIFSDSTRMTVTNSRFSNNRGLLSGAIYNRTGRVTVTNSTFTDNSNAGAVDGSFGSGGAIFSGDRLAVENCTFSNNHGGGLDGGAINNGGRLTVANSTFADNRAAASGGGAIYSGAPLMIINSTLAGNGATEGGATLYGSGSTLTLKNTIVANSAEGDNCGGPVAVVDGGHNLDSGSICGFSSARGSLSNTDPHLDPAGLADNGGPTQTIAVEAGSPAINGGSATTCARAPVRNYDQRALVRPGFGSASCTIGAYEFYP